jgi:hypothetical protein
VAKVTTAVRQVAWNRRAAGWNIGINMQELAQRSVADDDRSWHAPPGDLPQLRCVPVGAEVHPVACVAGELAVAWHTVMDPVRHRGQASSRTGRVGVTKAVGWTKP